MAGIDSSRIVGKEADELDHFMCGICHDVFRTTETPCCRQIYCKECITEWLTASNSCPNDRKPLNSSRLLSASLPMLNIIDKMRVKCVHHEKGCPSVHKIGDEQDHLNVCQFAQCKTCGSKDLEFGHNCLTYLLEEKVKVSEENRKQRQELSDLKTAHQITKMESHSEIARLTAELDGSKGEWEFRNRMIKERDVEVKMLIVNNILPITMVTSPFSA